MNNSRIACASALMALALSIASCGHGLLPSSTTANAQGRTHPLVSQHVISMLDGATVTTTEFAREQPYIDWVGNADTSNYAAAQTAGMKIFWYTNIARIKEDNPFINNLLPSDFAYDCTHTKVYALAPGETKHLFLTDPTSAHVRSLYETTNSANGMDGALLHNADAVDYDAAAKWRGIQTGLPCHAPGYTVPWTRQDWIGATAQFILQSAMETHYRLGPNGLSTAMGYNGLDVLGQWVTASPQFASDIAAGQTPPTTTGLDAGGGFGGRDEGCYGPGGFLTNYTDREYDSNWTSYENTEIQVGLIDNAHFICMYGYGLADNTTDALPGRMYGFASYMLTYNPITDILFDAFADPNTDQGNPEEQLVFLNPVGIANSSLTLISSLAKPGGYAREYSSCYQNGVLILPAGKCAIAVNSTQNGPPMTWPFTGYSRTLTLHLSSTGGGTILSGGTATIGPPAPTTVGPGTAVIGFQ